MSDREIAVVIVLPVFLAWHHWLFFVARWWFGMAEFYNAAMLMAFLSLFAMGFAGLTLHTKKDLQ